MAQDALDEPQGVFEDVGAIDLVVDLVPCSRIVECGEVRVAQQLNEAPRAGEGNKLVGLAVLPQNRPRDEGRWRALARCGV